MEIAPWLEEHINKNCPYCGAPIVNNQLLTDRFCSNEKCPEHMAQKIVVLAKRLDVKNFGIASAREAVRLYKFQLHTQIIPYWFKEKPSLYLHEVGEICLIKGHQKKWRQYCEGHDTMLQVLRSPRTPPEIRKQGVLLICTAAMCNIIVAIMLMVLKIIKASIKLMISAAAIAVVIYFILYIVPTLI